MSHRVRVDPAGRTRRGRALLAGGAVVGLGAVATLATWSEDIWVVSSFTTTPVNLESSREPTGAFDDHESGNALEMFSAPLSLIPGQTKYAHFYLRTASDSMAATVVMGSAGNAPSPTGPETGLWNTYIKYGARAVDGDPACSDAFDSTPLGTVLAPSGSGLAFAPSQAFGLQAASANTIKVCFEFALLSTAVTANPSVNGKSITPAWAFTGEVPAQ
ncbi:hypothetical protein [Dietzia maris]|uniref:hypothetical protein n=1 Tax=Dietzia maris TaxID=37915 RepID=UPI00232CE40C|nr:hypothetical protein [Dietzia maris]